MSSFPQEMLRASLRLLENPSLQTFPATTAKRGSRPTELLARIASTGRIELRHLAKRERCILRQTVAMRLAQSPKQTEGHLRVLVRAEGVLEPHQVLDHLSGRPSVERKEELEGVAHSFGADPQPVQLLRGR